MLNLLITLLTVAGTGAGSDAPTRPADLPGAASRLEGARRLVYKQLEQDREQAQRVRGELALHIFFPDGWTADDERAAVLYFHGGGWGNGSPDQFEPFARDAAAHGMVAATVEYRLVDLPGINGHDCIADACSAVEWAREHAEELGIDPHRIAAGGGSAGGQLALSCIFEKANAPDSPPYRPDALVLMNPVLQLDNSRFAGRFGGKASAVRASPLQNVPHNPPPMVMFLGTEDDLIPVTLAERFGEIVRERGGRFDLHLFPERTHGFFNRDRGGEPFGEVREKTRSFLQSIGFIESEETRGATGSESGESQP